MEGGMVLEIIDIGVKRGERRRDSGEEKEEEEEEEQEEEEEKKSRKERLDIRPDSTAYATLQTFDAAAGGGAQGLGAVQVLNTQQSNHHRQPQRSIRGDAIRLHCCLSFITKGNSL
ncbi:hypothetical protein CRUP_008528 [Coryphaenoides rupestris]|nr:hypothetical protein CRUP_008528 [Coryphaenoides rupestris]